MVRCLHRKKIISKSFVTGINYCLILVNCLKFNWAHLFCLTYLNKWINIQYFWSLIRGKKLLLLKEGQVNFWSCFGPSKFLNTAHILCSTANYLCFYNDAFVLFIKIHQCICAFSTDKIELVCSYNETKPHRNKAYFTGLLIYIWWEQKVQV